MKNKALLLLLLAALYFPISTVAQTKRCNTFESQLDFQKKNPGAQTDAQFESWLSKKIKETPPGQRLLSSYTIPVIFHIVHNGEAVGTGSNISAAKVQQQLDQVNADFANASGSAYTVAASANIQFQLAVIDPQGRKLAEPGIERINRNERGWNAPPYNISTYNSYADVTIMPASIWNAYAYFNVWVMDIEVPILGKSTFPSLSTLADLGGGSGETDNHAGVLLDYRSVGSVAQPGFYGTSAGLGRTLTHEAGHFFGLRHIWGDADCGNDYCNDTPTQFEETTSCPAGQQTANCTTTAYKMYENYMDYTFDACVNTFTADQVARMQTVMANSPRRKELAQAGTHIAPPENSIRFANVLLSFSENGVHTASCPAYREVEVDLNLFDKADGDATIQFTKSGNAQTGIDYELVTPSLTFNAGDGSKKMVLRIYDDGVTEGDEDIVLAYTITGSGVQAGSENQTLQIKVADNDHTSIDQSGKVQLFNEDFGANGSGIKNQWSAGSFRNPAGANMWTVSSNNSISGQSAHITNNTTTKANTYTITSTSDAYLISGPINAKGFSNISLSFNYKCVGEFYNSVDVFDYGTLLYSLDGVNFQSLPNPTNENKRYQFFNAANTTSFSENFSSLFDNQIFYLGFRWINDYSDGANPGFTVDDIVITADALTIGNTAGQSAKQSVQATQVTLLKNSNQLIAKVENAAANLGCVTATINQGGEGRVNISTQNGAYLRTQKVVQITPEQQAKATVTLYFTTAELAQWGTAKGSLKILKVKDGVSLNGVLNSSDAELITPDAVTEHTAEGYISYTCTVASFSQFMLVAPTATLPVRLVQFSAKPIEKKIQLHWLTADEKENKGFWMERSTNGKDFQTIGWMAANTTFAYAYTDALVQPGLLYYYRLKQLDHNGSINYSGVQQAKVETAGVSIQVAPNPVQDVVQVLLKGSTGVADLQLIDANGQTVGEWKGVQALNAPVQLPVGHLPKGIYTLRVILPQGIYSQKVLKR